MIFTEFRVQNPKGAGGNQMHRNKMAQRLLLLPGLLVVLGLCSLSGLLIAGNSAASDGESNKAARAASAAASAEAQTPVSAAIMEQGEKLYMLHCRFCHGTKGTAGKRLKGNAKMKDGNYVAHVILIGPGYMTPFKDHLNDEEVALITTYVRNAWGNDYGAYNSAAVAAIR